MTTVPEQALVALESTVISHGLPYPRNLTLAHEMEEIVRSLRRRTAHSRYHRRRANCGVDSGPD